MNLPCVEYGRLRMIRYFIQLPRGGSPGGDIPIVIPVPIQWTNGVSDNTQA